MISQIKSINIPKSQEIPPEDVGRTQHKTQQEHREYLLSASCLSLVEWTLSGLKNQPL